MSIALVARGDRGGLAAQTIELHRHLRPAKTLVMDLGRTGRGVCSLSQYTHGQIRVNAGAAMTDANLTWLLDDTTVVVTVEADYRPDLWDIAHTRGVRTLLIANPELYRDHMAATVIVCPTTWEIGRMPPGTMHVPQPVALDRLPYRQRTSARTFLHVAAPAMLDRNGTGLVWQALRWVTEPCRLLVRGVPFRHLPAKRKRGYVEIVVLDDECEDYWTAYPDEADVLLMPRRYGGLCLPVQECAALGIPSLMLDVEPQHGWPGVRGIPASVERRYPMKGGVFDVHTGRARDLAAAMDALVQQPRDVAALSSDAGGWARGMGWETWGSAYQALVEMTGARR